jgi:hypothetical protein
MLRALEALSKYIVRKGSRELATDPSEEYKDTPQG